MCVCVCVLHLNHATRTPHTSHNIKPITPFACFALFLPVSSSSFFPIFSSFFSCLVLFCCPFFFHPIIPMLTMFSSSDSTKALSKWVSKGKQKQLGACYLYGMYLPLCDPYQPISLPPSNFFKRPKTHSFVVNKSCILNPSSSSCIGYAWFLSGSNLNPSSSSCIGYTLSLSGSNLNPPPSSCIGYALFICFLPWVVFLVQRNERSRARSVGFLWLWYVIYLVL